jgi:replicative DNA helicase
VDLDREFVGAVLRGGKSAFLEVQNRDLDPEVYLFGEGKTAWNCILEHWKQYNEFPSRDIVSASTGCDLSTVSDDGYRFFLDEVMNRRLYHIVRDGAVEVDKKLEGRDPRGAAELWVEIHRKIQEEELTENRVESLLALGKDVIELYDRMKSGDRGIPTPWSKMDEQTMGWWPEDLIVLAGRLGAGKTWLLLLLAHAAWQSGSKVLIVGTEMNKVKLAMRFFALHFKMPYDHVRKGRLSEFTEDTFRKGVTSMLKDQGIYLIGGGKFDFSMDSIDAAVADAQPDIVFVDGAYLIKNRGKDRHERVSNTFDDLKRMGASQKIAVVANTQLNREAKAGQKKTISAENVGITDVAGWNADVMYGLHQDEEMRDNNEQEIIAMKIREGRTSNFTIRWDLEKMDFSEISTDDDQKDDGFDAPPAGSGTDKFDDLPF